RLRHRARERDARLAADGHRARRHAAAGPRYLAGDLRRRLPRQRHDRRLRPVVAGDRGRQHAGGVRGRRPRHPLGRRRRGLRARAPTALVRAGALVPALAHYPLTYLCLPPLVWSAFRFGPRDTAAFLAVLAAIAVAGTSRGLGPLAVVSPNAALLLLQVFLGTL